MRHSSISRPTTLALLLLSASAWFGGTVWADVVELTNGGRIEGKVVDGSPSDPVVVIEVATGGKMELPQSEVSHVEKSTDAEAEYELAHGAPDTVDAQWKLAEWSREHKLSEQSKQHLARVLELDPDHKEAGQLMGYREVSGDWMTRDEQMAARGLVEYEGKWLTRQHVELLEREKQLREATADWSKRWSACAAG